MRLDNTMSDNLYEGQFYIKKSALYLIACQGSFLLKLIFLRLTRNLIF